MKLRRLLKHLFTPHWVARRAFSGDTLRAIGEAVHAAEARHRGELRFVVEGPLHLGTLLRNLTPRQRAIELFAQLRIWDTEENSGILIYVQLTDRKVEILADRGIAARVPQSEWDGVCRLMEVAFRSGDWRRGALDAVARASDLLALHFPLESNHSNELPDEPLLL